ncbi:GntR family transcriptional regulator [Oceanobacillus halotolerans]|uniref:GntR family transcriptional regulator n=1 Tax=Oceanobacillus halotolerans TaxID=2663380 RepID=UPI0013DC91BC|nr:GntR family transcriptional regulator [Oceanobacillus halotolerans]
MELQQTQPLYQQVYEQMKKLILTGELQPGSKLSVTRLAEEYKISRTPLREALRQLQKEGLLRQEQNRTTVVELNKTDFEQLCSCRLILEKEVIKLAVNEITDSTLNKMEDLLNKSKAYIRDGDNLKNFLEVNTKFHELIIYSISNKHLTDLLNHVRSLLLIYRANIIHNKMDNSVAIIQEHENIFKALKLRDTAKAVKSIEHHLQQDKLRGDNIFRKYL